MLLGFMQVAYLSVSVPAALPAPRCAFPGPRAVALPAAAALAAGPLATAALFVAGRGALPEGALLPTTVGAAAAAQAVEVPPPLFDQLAAVRLPALRPRALASEGRLRRFSMADLSSPPSLRRTDSELGRILELDELMMTLTPPPPSPPFPPAGATPALGQKSSYFHSQTRNSFEPLRNSPVPGPQRSE